MNVHSSLQVIGKLNYYAVVTIPLQLIRKRNIHEVVYISQLTNQCH